jgi:hypothetical protein
VRFNAVYLVLSKNFKNIKDMRSLNPTKSVIYYNTLRHKWKLFNKSQRQNNQPEMSFKQWLYNKGIDLSGRTKIEL